jgi:hypothetical protein
VRQLVIGELGERVDDAIARLDDANDDPYAAAERIAKDL